MHQALYDPNIRMHPLPDLPSDDELRQIQVSLSSLDEAAPHQLANPYGGLEMSVRGDLVTVANWIDEHLEIFDTVMSGDQYRQGELNDSIKRQLLKGGVQQFGGVVYDVGRAIPPHML